MPQNANVSDPSMRQSAIAACLSSHRSGISQRAAASSFMMSRLIDLIKGKT
jgi:hypothetical protein